MVGDESPQLCVHHPSLRWRGMAVGKVYEMKIIVEGVVPPLDFWWWGKKFSCKNCGCVFQLEKGDYDADHSEFRYICPTCKRTLYLKRPAITKPNPTAIFEEVFGDGGIFEDVFGKKKL